jgi:peptidoglycan hydrolase-like protein with peptidoglycan-binding domain
MMKNKSPWQKIKDTIIYLFFTLVFLSLTASFVVEDVYAAADRISMEPDGIAEVYAINIGAAKSAPIEEEKEKDDVEVIEKTNDSIVVTEYVLGDKSAEILNYEEILYTLGYMVTEPSDTFTEEAQTALKTYQAFKGLETTGKLDRSTIISLLAEDTKFKKGESSQVLKTYQEILVEQKYLDQAEATGTFGESTEVAVAAFQKANGLTENGIIDTKTLAALDALRNTQPIS